MTIQALDLARDLIKCPSVTPKDEGALGVLQTALESLGFECHRQVFEEPGFEPVDNLHARRGKKGRNFCFAGHTDVVPEGELDSWTVPPYEARIEAGRLFGRGAADMKSSIACFTQAVQDFLAARPDFDESISFLITGDEEKDAVNGTVKLLGWCANKGEHFDACLVGEPTNPLKFGQMMKVGRRGSISGWLTVNGRGGHVAYPERNDNPIPRLVKTLDALNERVLDEGTDLFQASNLEITTVDVGNPANNVVPSRVKATFNVRFNNTHQGPELEKWFRDVCAEHAGDHDLKVRISGEAFLSPPAKLAQVISDATEAVTGSIPERSTTGGTSDARFIHHYCEVAEFGLVGQSMHKANENVLVEDIDKLTKVYVKVLENWFD
jgi:succinyl-diaminopimelate desuccinylase